VSVRIHIPVDVVVDDEIREPLPGVDIPLMGVQLGWMWTADGRDESFEGVVEWSRVDDLDGLVETVLAISTFKALTREAATTRIPEKGDKVTLRGSLSCMRSYEFEDSDLPDIRQSWRVVALLSQDRAGYVIEAEPIPPQRSAFPR